MDETFDRFGDLPRELQTEILKQGSSNAAPQVKKDLTHMIYSKFALDECNQSISDHEYQLYLDNVNPVLTCLIYYIVHGDGNEYISIRHDIHFGLVLNRRNESYIHIGHDVYDVDGEQINTTIDIYNENNDRDEMIWEDYLKRSTIYSSEYGLLTAYRILSRRLSCLTQISYSPRDHVLTYLDEMYENSDRINLLVFLRINAVEMELISDDIESFREYEINNPSDETLKLIDVENLDLYVRIKVFLENLPRAF